MLDDTSLHRPDSSTRRRHDEETSVDEAKFARKCVNVNTFTDNGERTSRRQL